MSETIGERMSRLIAPGFVGTPLSAAILADGLEARREELRSPLPALLTPD